MCLFQLKFVTVSLRCCPQLASGQNLTYLIASFFQHPQGIGAKLDKGLFQSLLHPLNLTFACTAARECFRSCSFVALRTTTHSARQTLLDTNNLPICHNQPPRSDPKPICLNRAPVSNLCSNWPPGGTPWPICP